MHRLFGITEKLSIQISNHTQALEQAHRLSAGILETLELAADTQYTRFQLSPGSWWPHIICPTASLILGSYGLPPSAMRNLGLLALGEVMAWSVASYDQLWADQSANASSGGKSNVTDSA
jgi:hypothetical protein